MHNYKKVLLGLFFISAAALMSCEEKACPDGMKKCDDGQGNTFCTPNNLNC